MINSKNQFLVIFVLIIIFISFSQSSISKEINVNIKNNDFINKQTFEIINKINESILRSHIQKIQNFGPHPTGSNNLNQLRRYLVQELNSYNLSVKLLDWKYKFKQGENIEATLTGKNKGTIILCAHYDSVTISPGADDDGSGVASVLHLAEIFGKYKFNSTIKFVFFSGEEQGLLGSRKYAEQIYQNNENIVGVICLDGIGYANDDVSNKTIKNYADKSANWIVDITKDIASYYHDFIKLNIIRYPNERISDHHSFYELGYQTSYFLEYDLNPFYHTSEDTMDKMNINYLSRVTKLIAGTISEMAKTNKNLKESSIKIDIKGSIFSYPDQLRILINNEAYPEETANLTVNIEMKNRKNGEYVKGPYNVVTNWVYSNEIRDRWEFTSSDKNYAPQFIKLKITLEGFYDDLGFFKQIEKKGVLIGSFVIFSIS